MNDMYSEGESLGGGDGAEDPIVAMLAKLDRLTGAIEKLVGVMSTSGSAAKPGFGGGPRRQGPQMTDEQAWTELCGHWRRALGQGMSEATFWTSISSYEKDGKAYVTRSLDEATSKYNHYKQKGWPLGFAHVWNSKAKKFLQAAPKPQGEQEYYG